MPLDPMNLRLRASRCPGGRRDSLSPRRLLAGLLTICAPLACLTTGAEAQSSVLGWGAQNFDSSSVPGPYEQIAPAYHTLTGWISEHGHEIAGPPREIYLNDPQTVAPEELLTRVEFPICSEGG